MSAHRQGARLAADEDVLIVRVRSGLVANRRLRTSRRRRPLLVDLPDRTRNAGRAVHLAAAPPVTVSSVLWCTGFRRETSRLDLPGAIDAPGESVHAHGAAPVPGLHRGCVTGRPHGSIIDGVDRDARAVAQRVRAHRLRG